MIMKKPTTLILLFLLALGATGVLQAQTTSDIAVARSDLQADRQAVVAANLPMTEAQAAAFWPVYRTYRTEMAVLGDQTQKMITAYANSYYDAAVTDAQGMALTKDYLKLLKATVELREKYVGRFSEVLPGKSVMRFYQIENTLDAMLMSASADEIPLVD